MISNRKILVGMASESKQDTTAVGILKLVRRGVVESGEYVYRKLYLASPMAIALILTILPLKDRSVSISEHHLCDGGA